jgi:hypothetical protein
MNLSKLTPTNLRIILIVSLVLIVALAGVIFYFANTSLRGVATSVSHKVADAEASRNNLENLKKIQKFLDEQKTTIERVNSIVAESQSYQYQDQIIIDLNSYATKAGIVITSINFDAPATAAAPATSGATATTPAAAEPAGAVKSTFVSVSIQSPVKYESFLKLVKSIEQNLTKMQISKISMSKGTSSSDVTTDTLNIEVYVR